MGPISVRDDTTYTCNDRNVSAHCSNSASATCSLSDYPDPAHIRVRSEDSLKLDLLEDDSDWANTNVFPNK